MAIDTRARIAAAIAAQNESPTAAGLHELDAATQRTADNWSDPIRAGLSYYRRPDIRMPRGRIVFLQNGGKSLCRVLGRTISQHLFRRLDRIGQTAPRRPIASRRHALYKCFHL